MSVELPTSCPAWCDPRAHRHHRGRETLDHRSIGFTWEPGPPSRVQLAVSAAQFEHRGHLGDVYVHVFAEDQRSGDPDGRPVRLGIDLTPEQAQVLAAALIAESNRVARLRGEVPALAATG